MSTTISKKTPSWELAAQTITVKIRWFGLIIGFTYVNFASEATTLLTLNLILLLGAGYTILDSWYTYHHRVFMEDYPLLVSFMEALFIGLLSYFDSGLNSPFRYYYLLSLICCAIRHTQRVTYLTCALDCISYGFLFLFTQSDVHRFTIGLLPIVLVWVTWAASSMSRLLKQISSHLKELNEALQENQSHLQSNIEARTRELQETQAQLMHQDKMAGFGLLAAGIAHEVGNPLTSISTLVQMLEKRDCDTYTRDKLALVGGQLTRIQGILRELMNFSRPANLERTRFNVHEIVDEALNIAKYYKGTISRIIRAEVSPDLPVLYGIRDQLVQVVFNLLLNAIDATGKGGIIELSATLIDQHVHIHVKDNGTGITIDHRSDIFRPYFTTKKQGTGLGLFVTKKLVNQHGGEVDFDSTPGHGTVFHIRIPVTVRSAIFSDRPAIPE